MSDLKNPGWIWFKGWLFLLMGVLAAGILFARIAWWPDVVLLLIAVWAFCRFYYFAFYVIQHYVDDEYRFAGLIDFAKYAWGIGGGTRSHRGDMQSRGGDMQSRGGDVRSCDGEP
ncbi:MAG: hypothetical protein AAFN70_10935 [Planctomycetota bacterium]